MNSRLNMWYGLQFAENLTAVPALMSLLTFTSPHAQASSFIHMRELLSL